MFFEKAHSSSRPTVTLSIGHVIHMLVILLWLKGTIIAESEDFSSLLISCTVCSGV